MYPRRGNLWPVSSGREEPHGSQDRNEPIHSEDSRFKTPPPPATPYTYPGITMTPGSFFGMVEAAERVRDYTLYPATWSPTPLSYMYTSSNANRIGARVGLHVNEDRRAQSGTLRRTMPRSESESSSENSPVVATPEIGEIRMGEGAEIVDVDMKEAPVREEPEYLDEEQEGDKVAMKTKHKLPMRSQKTPASTRSKRASVPRAKLSPVSVSTFPESSIAYPDVTTSTLQQGRKRKRVSSPNNNTESATPPPPNSSFTIFPTPRFMFLKDNSVLQDPPCYTASGSMPSLQSSSDSPSSPDPAELSPPKKRRRMKGPRLCTRKYARRDREADVKRRKEMLKGHETAAAASSSTCDPLPDSMTSPTAITPVQIKSETNSSESGRIVAGTPIKGKKVPNLAKSVATETATARTGTIRTRAAARREAQRLVAATAA